MSTSAPNQVRERREARGLSQVALAERVRLSRQSLGAIEAGRATPAVDVALRLAAALDCRVEELFGASGSTQLLQAESDAPPSSTGGPPASQRVALARVADRWVSYPLEGDALSHAADGLSVSRGRGGRVDIDPLRTPAELEENVVLMGCANGLGLLAARLNARRGSGRFLWFSRSSTAALKALAAHRCHLAGVHLSDPRTGEPDVAEVRRLSPGEPTVLVTLARWEAGLVVRADASRPIRSAADLGRRGLRLVGREQGAGAQRLLEATLRRQGLPVEGARRPQLVAAGHLDVARAVSLGLADTGVATRDAAMAFGLGFIPLAEERYDLALPRAGLADPRLQRLLDVLVSQELRRELSAVGYDVRPTGQQVAEVQAS